MFRIDQYHLRVVQAQAELKIAEAANESQHRTVVAEQSNAAVTSESISRARANLKLATQILARHKLLLAKSYVSTSSDTCDAALESYRNGVGTVIVLTKRKTTYGQGLIDGDVVTSTLPKAINRPTIGKINTRPYGVFPNFCRAYTAHSMVISLFELRTGCVSGIK